jgi:hypothetical protein
MIQRGWQHRYDPELRMLPEIRTNGLSVAMVITFHLLVIYNNNPNLAMLAFCDPGCLAKGLGFRIRRVVHGWKE